MTTWTSQERAANSYLAQETSILDLILQEDGGYLVVDYGTNWTSQTKS